MTNTSATDCAHVTDPELRRFYADHPELMPACCWFAGRPMLLHADGRRTFVIDGRETR